MTLSNLITPEVKKQTFHAELWRKVDSVLMSASRGDVQYLSGNMAPSVQQKYERDSP